jgi:hypothetical protein
MAMTSCPECRKEVSSKACACPHCGYPLKEQDYRLSLGNPVGGIFELVLKVCACISWIGGAILAFTGGKAINVYVLQPPHIDQKKTVYPVISNRSILT